MSLILDVHLTSITFHVHSYHEKTLVIDVEDKFLHLLAMPQHDELVLPICHCVIKAAADWAFCHWMIIRQLHSLVNLVEKHAVLAPLVAVIVVHGLLAILVLRKHSYLIQFVLIKLELRTFRLFFVLAILELRRNVIDYPERCLHMQIGSDKVMDFLGSLLNILRVLLEESCLLANDLMRGNKFSQELEVFPYNEVEFDCD